MSYENHLREIEALVAAWDARTARLEPERPIIPVHVLLGDAVDLAAFVEAHHAAREVDGVQVPGLASVEEESGVTLETARELMELQAALAHVHAKIEAKRRRAAKDPLALADSLLSQIRSGLSFLLVGPDDAADALVLGELRQKARRSRAHDHVAVVLEGFVSLAARHADRLERVGVSRSTLRAALDEAASLRARSAERMRRNGESDDAAAWLPLRNRLIAALGERVRRVRHTARFVYREHPEIARLASSGYAPRSARPEPEGSADVRSTSDEEPTIAA